MKGVRRTPLWVWLLILIVAYAYIPKPMHFVAFKSDAWFNIHVAIVLGGIFGVAVITWYFTRPPQALPANFANRWVGMPVLLAAAAASVGVLSAATIVPFGLAMVRGSRAPIVVEVTANFYIPGRRRGLDCQHFVLLSDHFSWGPKRLCLGSETEKRMLQELEPEAFVELTGWGDQTAMFYWSVRPIPAP